MHSLIRSDTGSLCDGVSRKSELLIAQVGPAPVSLAMNPPDAFATTLIHGAGGSISSASLISYSFASLNPPIPLKNASGPALLARGESAKEAFTLPGAAIGAS